MNCQETLTDTVWESALISTDARVRSCKDSTRKENFFLKQLFLKQLKKLGKCLKIQNIHTNNVQTGSPPGTKITRKIKADGRSSHAGSLAPFLSAFMSLFWTKWVNNIPIFVLCCCRVMERDLTEKQPSDVAYTRVHFNRLVWSKYSSNVILFLQSQISLNMNYGGEQISNISPTATGRCCINRPNFKVAINKLQSVKTKVEDKRFSGR